MEPAQLQLNGKRQCSGCTKCCELLNIPELNKPMGQKCPKECALGCTIYNSRPNSCRQFSCSWLLGDLPDWAKPDKINVVISVFVTEKDTACLVAYDDAGIKVGIKALTEAGWPGKVEVWKRDPAYGN